MGEREFVACHLLLFPFLFHPNEASNFYGSYTLPRVLANMHSYTHGDTLFLSLSPFRFLSAAQSCKHTHLHTHILSLSTRLSLIVYIWIILNTNCGGKPLQGLWLVYCRKATSGPRIFYRAVIGCTKTVVAFCLKD